MADHLTANVSTGPGYKCWSCGMWVSNGVLHTCGGNTQPAPPVQFPINPDVVQLRIAAALERIAAALEAPTSEGKENA